MEFDLTRPNSGRVLDYWLGGEHNFEIDRQLAKQTEQAFPIAVEMSRQARYLVRRCVEYFHAHGIRTIIDFGSSLPTCDNTHQVAHALDPNIKVVYSDIDPITAAYGQDLLRGNPNVIYLQADAAQPLQVLDNPLTRALIGNERRVGFIYLALAHFIADEPLRTSWRTLYEWAAPGSLLAASMGSEHWETDPELIKAIAPSRRSNMVFITRTKAQFLELAAPWQVTEEGVQPNTLWGLPNLQPPSPWTGYSAMFHK